MDAYKTIVTKRDRRNYDSRNLEEDAVNRILQAGRMAGSSSNSQPCRLIVVRDPDTRRKLATGGRGGEPLRTAPLCVVVALEQGASAFDAGRVAQNMMLAAWSEGIINCPIGLQDEELSRDTLGIPENFGVAIAVAFGYPAPNEAPRESRKRLALEELVHQERW